MNEQLTRLDGCPPDTRAVRPVAAASQQVTIEDLQRAVAAHKQAALDYRRALDKYTEIDQACKDAQDLYLNANHAWRLAAFDVDEHKRTAQRFPLPEETAVFERKLKTLENARAKTFEAQTLAYQKADRLQLERKRQNSVMNDLQWRESEARGFAASLRATLTVPGLPPPAI
jgi:hypothetical protein